MGSIKDRNGMDLTEAEDIEKRWQEYTEELYKNSESYLLTTHFYCFHYSMDKYFLNIVRKKSLVPSVQFSRSVM